MKHYYLFIVRCPVTIFDFIFQIESIIKFIFVFTEYMQKQTDNYTIFEYYQEDNETRVIMIVFTTTPGKTYEFPFDGETYELKVRSLSLLHFIDISFLFESNN